MSRVESDLFVRIGLANLDLQVKMVGFVITIWVQSRDSDLQILIVIMNLRFVRIQLVYSTKDSWGLIGFVKITWIFENCPDSWLQFKSNLLKTGFVVTIWVESKDSWDKSTFLQISYTNIATVALIKKETFKVK